MAYVQGENRTQLTLTPMCLDDYIGKNNICRVILAYVSSLDMSEMGFKYAKPQDNGRPPYNPTAMLMLYLYGYLNRIRSSRRLELETQRNVEVMWLMENLTPDDKTICNFRKDNAKALKKVFSQFSHWCDEHDLYGKELVAVDGSKFRANASRKSIHTQKGTETKLAEVEKKINEYMNELEKNDKSEVEETELDSVRIGEILKHLSAKKETLREWLKRIEENNGEEISTVDPDAHLMHTNGDGRPLDACYNVQTVVDSKHKLIVDFDVTTCPDDTGALTVMTESAKEIMGADKISVTADKGYYNGEDIRNCEEDAAICYIPKTADYAHAPDKNYDKSNFKYEAETDCYVCPEGQRLPFRQFNTRGEGKEPDRVYYDTKVCRNCPNKEKCTINKRGGRKIYRNSHQDALDVMNARMNTAAGREVFRERKKIVEHPFGTTKAVWGFKQFLCRGKDKTTGEASLVFLAYNFRRVFNIFTATDKDIIKAMA